MFKKILKKINIEKNMSIDGFIENIEKNFILLSMLLYLVINLIGYLLKIVQPTSLPIIRHLIHYPMFILLAIGIKRIVVDNIYSYKFLMLSFLISIFNQFIYPYENFLMGYLTLIATLIIIFLTFSFLYRLKDFSLYILMVSIIVVFAYDFIFFKANQEIVIAEIRVIIIFLLIVIFWISKLIKDKYYLILKYINKLIYRDYETHLFNKYQLVNDIKKYDKPYFLIGISFEKIDKLFKKYTYFKVNRYYIQKVIKFKNILEQKLYRLDESTLAFVSFEKKDIKRNLDKLNNIFKHKNENIEFDFKYSFLGTKYNKEIKTPKQIVNQIYELKYSNLEDSQNNRITWYNSNLSKQDERILYIESNIEKAIENEIFEINIQPKISLNNKKYISGEVLARWNDDKLGYISPYEFIKIIEQEGLMIDFTRLIFKKTNKFMKKFKRLTGKESNLAVNISFELFKEKRILKIVKNIFENEFYKNLTLEITEDTLFEMNDYYKGILNELNNLDINISIDDFGTGYSNFEYLKHLEINDLKIDKKFIDNIHSEDKSKSIVKGMIQMAHALDMKVVAEGVEKEDQVNILKDLNCQEIQGYFYSKPLGTDDFISFYKKIIKI